VLVIALGSWGKYREGDPKGWSTVLVNALGSWGKPVPRGHYLRLRRRHFLALHWSRLGRKVNHRGLDEASVGVGAVSPPHHQERASIAGAAISGGHLIATAAVIFNT
jgi:hypothetical protein